MDGKGDLDAYLQRFNKFAATAKWEMLVWAIKLSVVLSGQALDVYSCLSEEAANEYDQMKVVLMKRHGNCHAESNY